jgi:hypothetical protein
MKKFVVREILPEYKGMKDVIKKTHKDGTVLYHTHEYPFTDEAYAKGACKLNVVDNEFGHYLHLFNSKNETVGVYKMTSRLRGFTIQQLAEQKRKIFCCKMYNQEKDIWETYVDGTLVMASSYKEGCGLATILNDGYYYVVDKENKYIVPPGKYDYIDGFDKCGLARVKIDGKVNFIDPTKSTKDRWGIIDIDGNEVLPLIYSEIWAFYNKNRLTTTIWKGDDLTDMEDGVFYNYYQEKVYKYDFVLKTHELRIKEDWSQGNYNCLDPNNNWDPSDEYTIEDALDGEPEATGNIDYE